jgi:hypothetical protein
MYITPRTRSHLPRRACTRRARRRQRHERLRMRRLGRPVRRIIFRHSLTPIRDDEALQDPLEDCQTGLGLVVGDFVAARVVSVNITGIGMNQ